MNYAIRLLAVMLLLSVLGCSTSAPRETSVYLLRAEPSGAVTSPGELGSIGIGAVQMADYLNEQGIVLELGNNRINYARYHVWAEPLRNSIKSMLTEDLARRLKQSVQTHSNPNTWERRIDVYIDQLHGTADGQLTINATWRITSANHPAVSAQWQHTDQVAAAGYSALVEAHRAILADLTIQIASTLGSLEP